MTTGFCTKKKKKTRQIRRFFTRRATPHFSHVGAIQSRALSDLGKPPRARSEASARVPSDVRRGRRELLPDLLLVRQYGAQLVEAFVPRARADGLVLADDVSVLVTVRVEPHGAGLQVLAVIRVTHGLVVLVRRKEGRVGRGRIYSQSNVLPVKR